LAQLPNQIIAAGYAHTIPAPQVVAPGQVITLFVRGISVPDAAATGLPLPTSLSGVSVGVTKLMYADLVPDQLPIFKIHSEDLCAGRLAVKCPSTQITVQIPTEAFCMSTAANGCDFIPEAALILNVKVNGAVGQDYPISIYGSVPHLLNSCDTVAPSAVSCNDLVTHAGGSLVSAGNPAKPGETIVVYADGLGRTDPLVPTGTAVSAPTPTIAKFPIAVSFRKEGPGAITMISTGQMLDPVYSGLTPNSVGLYQINIVAPTPPAHTYDCVAAGFAATNTQLSLGQESVNICVSLINP
jgi:uncharacterized protein (TIGR03437 family)